MNEMRWSRTDSSLDRSYEWDAVISDRLVIMSKCVTYAGVPALADVSLGLTDAVDLHLVPFSGSLQHIQTGQQRVLLLLQLLHLLQLTEHMWKIWPTSGLIQRPLLKTSIFSIYSFSRCFLSKVRTTKALLGYQAAVWNSCLDAMSLFTIMIYNVSGLVIFSTSLPSLIFRHKWDSEKCEKYHITIFFKYHYFDFITILCNVGFTVLSEQCSQTHFSIINKSFQGNRI